MSADICVLHQGGWHVELDPAHGGQIIRADWNGTPVLAPGQPGRAAPEQSAGCFPLVPYSNRIRDGQFLFDDRTISLPPPRYVTPHALHGWGWRAPWRLASLSGTSAKLELDHEAADWPWDYRAEQSVSIDGDALMLSLSVTNRSQSRMPAGIGFHPYFVRPSNLTLEAKTLGRWATDPAAPGLPLNREDPPTDLATTELDHCFFGWDRRAGFTISGGLRVELTASPVLSHLVMYTPAGQPFFCIEPVSHPNNAPNLADAGPTERLVILDPGETLSGWMRLEVQKYG
jgi:aldose 1-epimerase